MKYILSGTKESLLREIDTSLIRLEQHLKIIPGNKNLLRRFLTLGRVLMEEAEREYQIKYDTEKDYQFRVGAIRHAALNRAGEKLGIPFHKEDDAIQKIREVFTVLDGITSGLGKEKISISNSELALVQKDVDRAYLFLVIKPESLFAYPSAERFIEWIYRFENLVFGKTNPRPRRARVIFSKPFGLSEYYQLYKENKKKTVEEVTARLRNEIEILLKEAVGFSRPIVEPFDVGEDIKI